MPLHFEKLDHLTRTLESYIYRDAVPLESWLICDKLAYGSPLPSDDDPAWRELRQGELWGTQNSWAWLITNIDIPAEFAEKPVALHLEFDELSVDTANTIYSSPEALVRVSGLDVLPQAINEIHAEVLLAERAEQGTVRVAIDCFTGVSQPSDHQVRLKVADLVWIDRDVEALYWDARVLLDTVAVLPHHAPEHGFYLRLLDEAFQQINWLNLPDAAFVESVREARAMLQARIYNQINDNSAMPRPVVHALGHAHIDVAWLWPLRVARGKAARTFSTALALMEYYPAYTFTQSTPYLYKIVAEDDPELFARIKTQIAAGQWNATGGTWVEMDANIPSGESLVRQFLYGMRYFEHELGVRPEVLWLPDGFGFCAALPQIMRQAGIRYFFTNKLSWNDHIKYPCDTFWWEGLDGSRVLAHLGTTPETVWDVGVERDYTTYVATMTPKEMLGTWTRYKQQDANHHVMAAFGLGDGGGGPNRDMVERRARMEHLPGLPKVMHSTAEQFFHAIEDDMSDDLPRWVGELYLQFHRGTYTSQARTKRFNRKSEVLLHDAEALTSILHLLQDNYPQNRLRSAWEAVLLNQFHDILPGSSIRAVHEESEHDYLQVQESVNGIVDQALATLAQHIQWEQDLPGFAIFNTIDTLLGGPVEVVLPGDGPVEIVDSGGQISPFQWLDVNRRRALIIPTSVPGYGYTVYSVRPAAIVAIESVTHGVTATPTILENGLLRAEFDESGNLIRLYDIENGRDVLEDGVTGNQLWAYIDRPHQFDAWEVEAYIHDQGWQLEPESSCLVENGPVRATLEIAYRFNKSQIVQRISLAAGQRLLIFETDVDWHEQHLMLKTHFPLAIRAMNATYDVQFGTVERPTHQNTMWDQAQFEVSAQQWADMSDGRYGVSLVNDCKYGHSAAGNVLTISLLRSPTYPDPEADQGWHQFGYAIYPHKGDWRNGTVDCARRFNHPLYIHPIGQVDKRLPDSLALVQCNTSGVVVDTVKKAEDSDELILRVYEAHGGIVTASLTFATPIEHAAEVNLLEETIGTVEHSDAMLKLKLMPYQIRSFRIKLHNL